ncbi:hypothetical protein os4_23190 [Comamonadaceae bacterium OS-4]|nr:hypothetical protein os4_23190 [Comamonadaceae bacterium OS-4]
MTPSEQAAARAKMAEKFLRDAQHPENSLHTRYSCAFDALYLYALVAVQAPDGLKSHPYAKLLSDGAQLLQLDMQAVDRLTLRMRKFGSQLEVTEEQVTEQIGLATAARKALQKDE